MLNMIGPVFSAGKWLFGKPSRITIILMGLALAGFGVYHWYTTTKLKSQLAEAKIELVAEQSAHAQTILEKQKWKNEWEISQKTIKEVLDKNEQLKIALDNVKGVIEAKDATIIALQKQLKTAKFDCEQRVKLWKDKHNTLVQNCFELMDKDKEQIEMNKGMVVTYETSESYIDLINNNIFK